MGSSASAEASRKRSARESWYAPISRCTSAPIRFVAEADDACLPSPLIGFDENTHVSANGKATTLESLFRAESAAFEGEDAVAKTVYEAAVHGAHRRDDEGFPRKRARGRFNSMLLPVAEASDCDDGDAEAIAKLEPPDEDDEIRKARHNPAVRNQNLLGKSQSFTRVHALDSCFTELKPLVWRKYFSKQSTEQELDLDRLNSIDGEANCLHHNAGDGVKGSMKIPSSTPSETSAQSPQMSPLNCPTGSPLTGSCSPVFDPSLLAKFEEAVDASKSPPPRDNFLNSNNDERSIHTVNHSWGLSKTAKGGESPQHKHEENLLATRHERPHSNDSFETPCELDDFESRCPPNGDNKVVLYFTSLRGIRKTYDDCYALRRILQGMGVRVDERDVWMHSQFREELTQLLGKQPQVPRLFIKGKYIGGVDESCQLHEDGLLAGLLVGMGYTGGKYRKACEGCADMRFVPCLTCHGSCKVLDCSNQVMRCSQCNENGLMLCPLCG